jgi:hypothetical protein
LFTDLYILLWVAAVYGGGFVSVVRGHLMAVANAPGIVPERQWVGLAMVLTTAGLASWALRALGPLIASPAEQTWGVTSPIDRGSWLLPRFVMLLVAGMVSGAVAAGAITIVIFDGRAMAVAVLAGVAYGAAAIGAGVVAQVAPPGRRWPAAMGTLLVAAGALAAGFGVVGTRVAIPAPPAALAGGGIVVVMAILAVAAVSSGLRALPRIGLAQLNAGAQIAAAVATTAIWLDPSVLSNVLEWQRWRAVGRVRSRRMPSTIRGVPARVASLLHAELARLARRPTALGVMGGLALAQFAIAVVAPSMAAIVRTILAYFVAGRFTRGLRVIATSPGLCRAIGGSEKTLRRVHIVVPAVMTALWWALTWRSVVAAALLTEVALLAGVVAAAYRSATRRPIRYDGALIETPLGMIPIDLILQLARGPDLLGVVILTRLILR